MRKNIKKLLEAE